MKVKRKMISVILTAFMLLVIDVSANSETALAAPKDYPVLLKINDFYVLYTVPKSPYIDSNNRMMIPLRSISELIGAKVGYDAKSKTATISMDDKTVIFTIGSKTVTVNGITDQLDTNPVLSENSMFIPISVLANHLGIQSSWDEANQLYTLTGENLMQTEMIKYTLEDIENGAWTAPPGKIIDNNAFMPISYTYDSANGSFVIRAKNITGKDLPKGAVDVAAYLLTDDSVQFPKRDRERPSVKKDGIIEERVQNGRLKKINYLLVKGRLLDRSSS
ncbi:copper amine oxidase N-terminal domain-containing protein [Paenibacillus sp. 7124]|uniref:Copper amine oxidase N-terminal domain-containing protein n=1 Tax=Paenibacillus apii TaxID=1850370 RepID=A0A6M1PEF1_9BACL|nr:copper amine oxidase N-terminal domain-containing protein [Paenibacillus apii]NGM80934.1 copper amine oxidase N-terminal domain-containing protein [Paenibacillus apii]